MSVVYAHLKERIFGIPIAYLWTEYPGTLVNVMMSSHSWALFTFLDLREKRLPGTINTCTIYVLTSIL